MRKVLYKGKVFLMAAALLVFISSSLVAQSTIRDALNTMAGAVDSSGHLSSPGLVVDTIRTGVAILSGETEYFDLGDISEYWEIYIVIQASAFDSAVVYFATSADHDDSWATGHTAFFDRNPSTPEIEYWGLNDQLSTYGTCFPIINTYGTFLPGPHGLMSITANAGDNLAGVAVYTIKRK